MLSDTVYERRGRGGRAGPARCGGTRGGAGVGVRWEQQFYGVLVAQAGIWGLWGSFKTGVLVFLSMLTYLRPPSLSIYKDVLKDFWGYT